MIEGFSINAVIQSAENTLTRFDSDTRRIEVEVNEFQLDLLTKFVYMATCDADSSHILAGGLSINDQIESLFSGLTVARKMALVNRKAEGIKINMSLREFQMMRGLRTLKTKCVKLAMRDGLDPKRVLDQLAPKFAQVADL